jgi:hypothetical protein
VNQFHLRLMQARVTAARAEQFIVPADLRDVTVLDHDETIGSPQGAQAMGDGDGRAATDEVLQRGLNLAFGLSIH